jgi:hypothetical protein
MIKLLTCLDGATLNQMIESTGVASTHNARREGRGPEKETVYTPSHLNQRHKARAHLPHLQRRIYAISTMTITIEAHLAP